LSSNPARRRQVDLVGLWIEDAETAEELSDLITDLEELREAAPILSDDHHDEPTDWWCPSCRRLLDDEEEACSVCREMDAIRPATTWKALSPC
jgi:hypothetical protein